MNRWCMYYAGDYSTSYSFSPCRIVRYAHGQVRVELECGRRLWLLKESVFRTLAEASAVAAISRGVNAWS